jgi:hypothetical protein
MEYVSLILQPEALHVHAYPDLLDFTVEQVCF